MKIMPVNYTHGGIALEVVADTPVETALLRQIFTFGEMGMGNGSSVDSRGMATGFYLRLDKVDIQ